MDAIDKYYLIDFENVGGSGLSGCRDLKKSDHIVIFFTQNAKNIDMTSIFDHGDAELEMIKVPAGKQSADMHIGSYLGYLAGKNGGNCNVVIVSNDTDYDKVINFWNEKTDISASRSQQIKKADTPKPQTNRKKPAEPEKAAANPKGNQKTKLMQEVTRTVKKAGYHNSVAVAVAQIADQFYGDEHMLSEVHNALRERYTDYLEVYATVKPVLSVYSDDKQSKNSTPAVPSGDKPATNSDDKQSKNSTPAVSAKDKTATNSEVQKALSKAGFSGDISNFTASTAVKNLGVKNGKQQTYRAIISEYGQKKGLAIYNCIKKYI